MFAIRSITIPARPKGSKSRVNNRSVLVCGTLLIMKMGLDGFLLQKPFFKYTVGWNMHSLIWSHQFRNFLSTRTKSGRPKLIQSGDRNSVSYRTDNCLCQMPMHCATLLSEENRRLSPENQKQKRRKDIRRSYIAYEWFLAVGEGLQFAERTNNGGRSDVQYDREN